MSEKVATLNLEEVPWNAEFDLPGGSRYPMCPGARQGDRVWLYLDYGDECELGRYRWCIHARAEQEGFWMTACLSGETHERGIDLLAAEAALAKQAIEAIRSKVAAEPRGPRRDAPGGPDA